MKNKIPVLSIAFAIVFSFPFIASATLPSDVLTSILDIQNNATDSISLIITAFKLTLLVFLQFCGLYLVYMLIRRCFNRFF